MNIIYMHTHDTGRFIEPYGYNVPTPNLMNLAREGVLFRHAYCAGPTCSPSRSALLTGMTPHSAGMFGLAHRGFQMNDYSKHIVQFLNSNGFKTVLCGIQHEAPSSEMIGYDQVLDDQNYHMDDYDKDWTEWDLSRARMVARYIKESDKSPFFLSFGMFNTHREFPLVSDTVNPNYVLPPHPLHDNHDNRVEMARFISSAKVVDQCVGIVLEALKESGREDDTLLIFTTDHGLAFPLMKCNLFDTGIGVSLIFKFPGDPQIGRVTDALVSHLDIFPTICDMVSIDKPEWLQGKSLLPILKNQSDQIRTEVFSEVTYHAAYEPMRCIRTERYKLIKLFDDDTNIVPANIDDSLSKDFLLKNGYLRTNRDREMLFDLYLDPVERINLINDKNYKDVYQELSSKLHQWMLDTNDPLLEGPVEKPAGARVNTKSALGPQSGVYAE
ncbi:sulfatase family protein [Alicyclobacillus mengziensis]|uniref:Sulfatase n=1 Tax=Alicyclobacillus mengziensis TaxID=2931921 RepID=A0A9X7VZI8_9BACL|nr:sulfatase [Alicyclobacillus mengziensis]QSO47490.1 sulfatase [Alicyclobacillus mengziensis]